MAVISGQLRSRYSEPEAVLEHIRAGTSLIVPLAAGEPVALLDVIEAAAADGKLSGVRVHQMHAAKDRGYMDGRYGNDLRHVSYFLSAATRKHFAEGTIDLVPNHFSHVASLLQITCPDTLIIAQASTPDRHGYFSLGTNADYVASFIGRGRFFLEVNANMPQTFGRNQLHITQVEGWCRNDSQLTTIENVEPSPVDHLIAGHIAPMIPNGSTLQVGIGGTPNALLAALRDHEDLGIHSELISDGIVGLIDSGVANGVRKKLGRTKAVGTFALGTEDVYEFIDENPAVEFWPANYVNNPFTIAGEPGFISINATIAVDLLGQCASETMNGAYWSSSGGQADFAQGAMLSDGGKAFIVVPSTAKAGTISRIVPTLPQGSVVTTTKNTVDHIVTEFGVARLRGRTVNERARMLIELAHPDHRDFLAEEAGRLGYTR